MNLNCETILDFYTRKNRKVLCQIKVTPTKSLKFKNTCRCLTQEQWRIFDKELEKIITTTDDWSDDKCLKFNIKPYIEVKVQKSKLSLKCFYKCLDTINAKTVVGNVLEEFVLECLFDFQPELQEYEPQFETSSDGKLSSPLSYEPYTPSKKKYRTEDVDTVKTPGIDFIGFHEDTYSPKPIFETTITEPLLTEKVPKYTPVPIKITRSSVESNKSSHNNTLDEVIVETEDEIESPKKAKILESKLNKKSKKREIEYIPKSQEFAVVDVPVYIPTPIEDNIQKKILKIDNSIRKHKKRSQTIDEFPGLLDENTKEKYNFKKEQLDIRENYGLYNTKNIKKRSKSIDEVPARFTFIEKPKLQNIQEKLESTNEITSNKSMEKKNDSSESSSSTKEKITQSDQKPEKLLRTSSSSEDDFLCGHIKSKKIFQYDNKMLKSKKLLQLNDSGSNINISLSSATESATDTSPKKEKKRGRKPKENSSEVTQSLRRSERSPSKPRRLIEEQYSQLHRNKSKISKTSPKNKELFGTDDDDDEEFFDNSTNIKNDNKNKLTVFETPVSKKSTKSTSSSSSSSSKKKRKRDKSSECEQEKRDMSKWLSKKKSSSSGKQEKKPSKDKSKCSSSKFTPLKNSKREKSRKVDNEAEIRTQSSSPTTFELPSKEELELIRNKTKLVQKENAKVRAELEKLRSSPPKEVEILSLQNIPIEDILDSFSTYKLELDEIYKNNRKSDYIKGHDGINHCFVIRLLQQNIQMKMLEKLTEVYSNTKNTAQATLFANALLPEWVMRLYMEKFNFTRQQAIDQIKAQEEFQLHMEEQSDNTFMFD